MGFVMKIMPLQFSVTFMALRPALPRWGSRRVRLLWRVSVNKNFIHTEKLT